MLHEIHNPLETLSLKKSAMKNLIVLFLIFLSISVQGQDKSSEAGGPPTRSELIGFWKKIDFPNAEKLNKVNPWPQKHQWFAFYDNGKVYSMMSDIEANYSIKDLEALFSILPADKTPNFTLEGQFLSIDNKEIKDYLEIWGVNLFAVNTKDFIKKGNLMMTLDDGNGNVIYYRLLKRIVQ